MTQASNGWLLAPETLTPEMVNSMRLCALNAADAPTENICQQVYSAALDARPKPPGLVSMPHTFEGMRRAIRIGYQVSTSEVRDLMEAYDAALPRIALLEANQEG